MIKATQNRLQTVFRTYITQKRRKRKMPHVHIFVFVSDSNGAMRCPQRQGWSVQCPQSAGWLGSCAGPQAVTEWDFPGAPKRAKITSVSGVAPSPTAVGGALWWGRNTYYRALLTTRHLPGGFHRTPVACTSGTYHAVRICTPIVYNVGSAGVPMGGWEAPGRNGDGNLKL